MKFLTLTLNLLVLAVAPVVAWAGDFVLAEEGKPGAVIYAPGENQ